MTNDDIRIFKNDQMKIENGKAILIQKKSLSPP